MKKLLAIIILLLSHAAIGQDSLLIGKWQLLEMSRDSVLTFDRNNMEISMHARFLNAQQKKVVPGHADSLKIINEVERIHPLMKMMCYEFREDNTLHAGILDWDGSEYYFATRSGDYMTDYKRMGISINGQGRMSYYYEIAGNILLMRPIIGGDISQRDYIKYERLEY